jgi:hypothetical protein
MSELKEKWREVFDWLTEQWTDEDAPWSDQEAGFLAELGLSAASGDAEVVALFKRIDEELTDDNRRATLTDETKRAEFFPELYEDADASTSAVVKIEPYWDGEQWLTWDAAADEWVPMAAVEGAVAADKDVKPHWDGERWLKWHADTQEWRPMAESELA